MWDYEKHVQAEMNAWGERSKLLNIKFFSMKTFERSFLSGVWDDVNLMAVAFLFVTTYSIIVLGSCSPVHFRA